MKMLLGYEVGTGEPVTVPVKHMAVTGATQEAGKTTTLEALISRGAADGLRALAFVTKRGEAPFPEGVPEFFIKGWTKPGDVVFDPFSGSGTTACVAARLGRIGIGADIRFSQCELGTRRHANPAARKIKVQVLTPHQAELFSTAGEPAEASAR